MDLASMCMCVRLHTWSHSCVHTRVFSLWGMGMWWILYIPSTNHMWLTELLHWIILPMNPTIHLDTLFLHWALPHTCTSMWCIIKLSALTLLSGCGGGKGVYTFFCLFLNGCFLLLMLFVLNFGKNLSQFSSFNFGSFANSLLIIIVWKQHVTACRQKWALWHSMVPHSFR